MTVNSTALNLFISYSHDDKPYFKIFSQSIEKVIKNTEHFSWKIWDDTKIHCGTFWDDEIQNNIKDCNVALLLVSVGFMASKYIKENEFNEFKKRYTDKGILIIPILFKPCDFYRWEDLGKLQFFKPSGAPYGKSDIEDFTYSDLIEFKKTDGTFIPNPNSDRYILDLVRNIEGSYDSFLKRKNLILSEMSASQSNNNNALSQFPYPSTIFTGREIEIIEFKKLFNAFRIFSIEGLGGTGKTQFVAKCIEQVIVDKSRIIWLDGSAQSNFDVFVENAGYGEVLKGEGKTNLAIYSGFKELLDKNEKIVIWDNYNDYDDLAFSNFLSFANKYLKRATIILITKTYPIITGVTSLPTIKLEGLNEDAIEYAKKLKQGNPKYGSISSLDLEKICNSFEGHPLAIEFSMLLMGYGKSADDITLHMSEFSGIKVEEFSKRLFLDIFNHQRTSEDERQCFLKCSVFKEKIQQKEIDFLHDGANIFHLLAGLIDKLLINYKDGYYEIHPLVRSFSYEKLLDKKSVHKKAAQYFLSQENDQLNPSLAEKILYHLTEANEWEAIANYIETNGRNFIIKGQLGLVFDLIKKLNLLKITRPVFKILLGDIHQIKSEWNEASLHFENAINDPENISIKAEGIIKYGEIFLRKGEYKKALTYFERACEFAKSNLLLKEEARALNDIGLFYYETGNLDYAYEKINKAIKIRKSLKDKQDIAESHNNLGLVFYDKNQFSKSLEQFSESIKIAIETDNKIGLALYYANSANSLTQQNKLDEAHSLIIKCLNINEEAGDKSGFCMGLNTFSIILLKQNKLDEALANLQESVQIANEIGDKRVLATAFMNIGDCYLELENYDSSLLYFFKCLSILIISENQGKQVLVRNRIFSLDRIVGKEKFKNLLKNAYENLDIEAKENIEIGSFFNEPVKISAKIGRNDKCPCGSGKKYKNCHLNE